MESHVVVEGEAPETDSDEDILSSQPDTPVRMTKSIQGAAIDGEDSESDDEHGVSISSAISALTNPKPSATPQNKEEEKFNSLLHKKLKERNHSLSINLQSFSRSAISEASRSLTDTDQALLRSQVTLQTAIGSLRRLGHHAKQLSQRVHSILTSNFFQNVRLPDNSG